jgi:hypothetical protein
VTVTRNLSSDGTFSPEAVNFLGLIPPPEGLFCIPHQLRHPDSIYTLSLEKVGEAYSKVADAYMAKAEECRGHISGNLEMADLEVSENFLRAIQEHLDDCWLILKALVDPESATENALFADRCV